MSKPGFGLLALFALIPLAANGQVGSGDLPDDTVWYLHANLAAIRSSDGGKPVWRWFEDEVVEDVKEDVGIDISAEVDAVTAFANSSDGTIIIVEAHDKHGRHMQTGIHRHINHVIHQGRTNIGIIDFDADIIHPFSATLFHNLSANPVISVLQNDAALN